LGKFGLCFYVKLTNVTSMSQIQPYELQQHMLPVLMLIEMFENQTYGPITKRQQDKMKSIKYYFDQLINVLETKTQKKSNSI